MKKKTSYNKMYKIEDFKKEDVSVSDENDSNDVVMTVIVNSLNHRETPSLEAKIVSVLKMNDQITIIEKSDDNQWGKTTLGGWVILKYCKAL